MGKHEGIDGMEKKRIARRETQGEPTEWEKHKRNQMDGESLTDRMDGKTQREPSGWENTKGIEWTEKQTGNRIDGKTQKESNG